MGESETTVGVCVGDVLAGKYRVDGVIGAGAMGVVVAAHHLQLDERVALKFLMPAALNNPEATARFAREARAAVKIKSEHVARVSDVGTLDDGAPYIVMEFLEGIDLGAWLRERGPLPVEQAVEFLLQACEAIAEAHSLGIIHRDLKPSNLFVVRRNDGHDCVKVLDFGISKMIHGGDMAGTSTHAVMGSPYYMSPEQMRSSRDVTPQSDVWALGVILYELLTGQSPFCGETFPEICVKIATEAPPPLRSVLPSAPIALEAAVAKCLEKDRAHRFKDVAELAFALQEFAPKRARASVERIIAILHSPVATAALATAVEVPRDSAVSETMSPYGRTTGGRGGRRRSTAAAAGVTAALVLGLGWVAAGRGALPWHEANRSPAVSHAAVAPLETVRLAPSAAPLAAAAAPPSPVAAAAPAPPSLALRPSARAPSSLLASGSPAAPPMPAAETPEVAPAESSGAPEVAPAESSGAPEVAPAESSGAPEVARTESSGAPGLRRQRTPGGVAMPQAAARHATAASSGHGSASSTPRAAAGQDCDPPFYFDDNGLRIFKKECVH